MSRSSHVCWFVLLALLAPACDPPASVPAEATERGWAVSAGGLAEDGAFELAIDPSGNVIVAGQIAGWAVFGDRAIATARGRGGFIAKLSPDGSFLWAIPVEAVSNTWLTDWIDFRRHGLGIDADGNIFFAGWFSGTARIDETTLVASGAEDLLVMKLSPDGKVIRTATAGGDPNTRLTARWLGVAPDGITLSGTFQGKPVFGATVLDSGANTAGQAFVARLGLEDLSFGWVTRAGSDLLPGEGHAVVIDPTGAALVGGMLGKGKVRIGEVTVESDREQGVLAKFSPGGELERATPLPGIRSPVGLALDQQSGEVVVYGAGVLPDTTHTAVARVAADGGLLWQRKIGSGGPTSETGLNALLVDGGGDLLGVGRLTRKSSFGAFTMTSSGAIDVLRLRLDGEGNVLEAAAFGGMGSDLGTAIASDAEGNVYVTGAFQKRARFGDTILDSRGGSDVFVWKIPRHLWRGSTPP